MNYKILIIKSGAVIVDLPENPKYEDISAVFADKAKQIRFKDENDVNLKLLLAMLLGDGDFLKVGQTFDLPDNLGVSFESCKMCEGTGQYEKPYQQFIKCNYCSNGKLAILTPITEAPVKSEGEEGHYPKWDLPPACVYQLQQIALADDEMVKQEGAAEKYRFIARHILELFLKN